MNKKRWLPVGHVLPDGTKLHKLLHTGPDWQIHKTDQAQTVLIANHDLANKWVDRKFLAADVLLEFNFGRMNLFALSSKDMLVPLDGVIAPQDKSAALAFANALRETRLIDGETSFHDAIYVAQHSQLLPIWSVSPSETDQVILGAWLTGGVHVSALSFRRLCALTGWATHTDLKEIIAAAGFDVPDELSNSGLGREQNDTASKSVSTQPLDNDRAIPASENNEVERRFTLPGRPQLETFFNDYIIDYIQNSPSYEALNVEFPSGIVLHGPPGCGKTFAVDRLVELIDWPSFSIDAGTVGSPYIHETSQKISAVFDRAIDLAPSVIVIDEMEAFLSERQDSGSSGLHHVEEVAEFLRRIPELIKKKVLIVGMTNKIEMIDAAILRRGRFDHKIEVAMPSAVEVEALMEALLEDIPVADDIELAPFLNELTNRPLSDVSFVVREGARLAAKNRKPELDQDCLVQALATMVMMESENESF